MCTVITLTRPGHAWPLLLAANRDERVDRGWDAPGAHWPDRTGVVGGRDRTGGGSWMAAGRRGVVAAVLNRPGSLGPAPGKRSRGDLPLLAAGQATAAAGAGAVAALDGREYRSFNMVIADRTGAWFVRNDARGRTEGWAMPPGLHTVTAHDPDDLSSPRVARHLPRFGAAPAPEPPDWRGWAALLADGAGPRNAALSVPDADGFGTVCASLFALRADGAAEWLFAPGPAGQAAFQPVALPPQGDAAGGEGAGRLL